MPVISGFDLGVFLNQPVDEVIIDLIWLFGWIPLIVVMAYGLMQAWVELQRRDWRLHRPYILLAIDVPKLSEQSPKAVENLFAVVVALKSSPSWLEKNLMGKNQWRHSFEITSVNGYIQFYIWTEERYRDTFEAALYAQYPDAEISLADDYTLDVPQYYPNEEYDLWGSEYVLDRENFFPLRTWIDYENKSDKDSLKDPLITLFEGLAQMKPGEQMWFQIVLEDAPDTWKKEGDAFINDTFGVRDEGSKGKLQGLVDATTSVTSGVIGDILGSTGDDVKKDGAFDDMYKAFKVTEQEREITKAVVRKIAKPGLRTKIRVIYIARKEIFSKVTRKDIVKGTLKQLAHGDLNKFGGANSPEDDYFWQVWYYGYYQRKLMEGYRTRSMEIGAKPSVLNIEELATIWHFPTINVKAPLIKKTLAKRSEPPTETPFATEQEELLIAPSMNMPAGEDSLEEPVVPDIFTAPLPQAPELPKIPQPGRRTTHKKSEAPLDLPTITSPTEGLSTPVVPVEVAELELPVDNVEVIASPKDPEAPTATCPTQAPPRIPDAIRVLIEQGVEPEDVGIHDTLEE